MDVPTTTKNLSLQLDNKKCTYWREMKREQLLSISLSYDKTVKIKNSLMISSIHKQSLSTVSNEL